MRSLTLCVLLFVCFSAFTQNDLILHFENDIATLNADQQSQLNNFVHAACADVRSVLVFGFADSLGTDAYNIDLSKHRAETVSAFLNNIAPAEFFSDKPLTVHWYGEGEVHITDLDDLAGTRAVLVRILQNDGNKNLKQEHIVAAEEYIYDAHYPLSDILHFLGDKMQQFTFNPSRDTLLVGNHGTVVFIPGNAFDIPASCRNQAAHFYMLEAYDLETAFANGLTTIADKKLLESGGMLFLQAGTCGRSMELREGQELTIVMPDYFGGKEDMELFYGSRSMTDDMVYWNAAGTYLTNTNWNELLRWKDYLDWADARAHCRFFWCKIGEFFRSIGREGRFGDAEDFCKDCWSPAWIDSMYAKYNVDNTTDLYAALNAEKLREIQNKFDEGNGNVDDMQAYIFNANQTGWMNCDRFLNVPQQVDIFVEENKINGVRAGFYFTAYNSVLSADPKHDGFAFDGVGKNETGYIFLLRNNKGQPEYFKQKITASQDARIESTFTPCSIADLKSFFSEVQGLVDAGN